jgi:hypothetical protein
MIEFSSNPDIAHQQFQAIIFYLTAFAYIDGNFDLSERAFIQDYIRRLAESAVDQQSQLPPSQRQERIRQFIKHYLGVFREIDHYIVDLFTEAVEVNEDINQFVYAKLKLRTFEIFNNFDRDNQNQLLSASNDLIEADGVIHPAEVQFREEVRNLLKTEAPVYEDMAPAPSRKAFRVKEEAERPIRPSVDENHPFFAHLETHYSANPQILSNQAAADAQLLRRARSLFNDQRQKGRGRLDGNTNISQVQGGDPFLDEYVYVVSPEPGREYELIVLGDLHGCYSCLKGALMQSAFFQKVEAYHQDPDNNPDVKLIFLGDYIDRGRFSLNGVLRTVLQLFINAPNHVFLLRGNHEYYVERGGKVISGVLPAEAITTLTPYLPQEHFVLYKDFFDDMPCMMFFEKTLFVHAGIPRDEIINNYMRDLSNLNDPDTRFQMLWSDPSEADFVPDHLQKANARFPFGQRQFERFMGMLGCHTLIRGHEKVEEGVKENYNRNGYRLITLFSAGGMDNDDLPQKSSYRRVTPMAITIRYRDGRQAATPWAIDYKRFNQPDVNGFYRAAPEL